MFPRPGFHYNIVSAGAPNKVLGCAGGACESGTQVVLWDRDGGANQNWIVEQVGPNQYRFAPQHAPGQHLDTNNGIAQNPCHLWDDGGNPQNPNQTFTLEPAGGHQFLIRRTCDGACLDVANFGTENGSTLWAFGECNRTPNQLWSFHFPGGPEIGARYHIVSAGAPSKVLGCASGACESGTQVVLWDRDGSPNQNWIIEHLNNGLMKFAPEHAPGQHLDTNNGVGQNPCHIWDDGGVPENPNQTFFVEPAGDGVNCIIRRACDGAVLDVANFGTENGSTLWAFGECNRTPNQLWSFQRV